MSTIVLINESCAEQKVDAVVNAANCIYGSFFNDNDFCGQHSSKSCF